MDHLAYPSGRGPPREAPPRWSPGHQCGPADGSRPTRPADNILLDGRIPRRPSGDGRVGFVKLCRGQPDDGPGLSIAPMALPDILVLLVTVVALLTGVIGA